MNVRLGPRRISQPYYAVAAVPTFYKVTDNEFFAHRMSGTVPLSVLSVSRVATVFDMFVWRVLFAFRVFIQLSHFPDTKLHNVKSRNEVSTGLAATSQLRLFPFHSVL